LPPRGWPSTNPGFGVERNECSFCAAQRKRYDRQFDQDSASHASELPNPAIQMGDYTDAEQGFDRFTSQMMDCFGQCRIGSYHLKPSR